MKLISPTSTTIFIEFCKQLFEGEHLPSWRLISRSEVREMREIEDGIGVERCIWLVVNGILFQKVIDMIVLTVG